MAAPLLLCAALTAGAGGPGLPGAGPRPPLAAPKPAAAAEPGRALATADVVAPAGFRCVQFAGDGLAHDVFCLTHDAAGAVVVSGPGYVKRLLDDDGDGAADRAQVFASAPQTGAQGMYFLGDDLLAVGDGGLLRFRDEDGDGVWDGEGRTSPDGGGAEPDKFLTFRTWGEHDVHAIRKGPDGWWYLIAGNFSEVGADYVTRETSPVPDPSAGVLVRFSPDLTGGEVVAHGMRNAYDFAFHPSGDAFTYDSDGERDVTLPWYRPTRVLALVPGSHAGWVSRSAKRPHDDPELPPVVCELGRGSPTGVICYRHDAFGERFRDALIVADWTFGRVIAVPLDADGAGWTGEPVELMTGAGVNGFAPTSLSVGPDGDLFVSVGGRGTRGGVYRLSYEGVDGAATVRERLSGDASKERRSLTVAAPMNEDPLTALLTAPQPLSAWSRAAWEPLAEELGPAPLRAAALDRARPAAQRVRAVEILTERHGGLPANVLPFFAADPDPAVRARACWSHAIARPAAPDAGGLRPFLTDPDPRVRRAALEALAGLTDPAAANVGAAVDELAACLGDSDRYVRAAAARVVRRLGRAQLAPLAKAAKKNGLAARAAFAVGYVRKRDLFDPAAVRLGLAVLESDAPADVRRDAVRLVQIALGDFGPKPGVDAAFEGYTPGYDLGPHEAELNRSVPVVQKLLSRRRQGREEAAVDRELVRAAAMLAPYNPLILGELCGRLTADSPPSEDLHHLLAAARLPVERSVAQTEQIADALVRLDEKVDDAGLNTDTNWEPRIQELYDALCERDPILPLAVVDHPDLGRPAHVAFLSNVPADALPEARAKFAAAAADPGYLWTGDVAFLLGGGPGGKELIRGKFGDRGVRGAVVMSLATDPEPADRGRFVEALGDADLAVVTAALDALSQLPSATGGDAAGENVALGKLLRALGDDSRGRGLKRRAVELLQRNTGEAFGFDGDDPATHPAAVAAWDEYLSARYPQAFAAGAVDGDNLPDLAAVDWAAGDAERGATVFQTRGCAACHGGRGAALGPDLAGVTGRFGRADLWTAILDPSRDVPSRYRTEVILTADGRTVEGLAVYQSADGVTLRDGRGRTWRVEADEILERVTGENSLMPAGLLDGAAPAELADLEAYLRDL